MQKFEVVFPEINSDYFAEAHRFLIQNPVRPMFSIEEIESLTTRLVSSPKNVVEVWSENKKLLTGVLTDLVTNPQRSNHINFFGFAKGKEIPPEAVILLIKTLEDQTLLQSDKAGVTVRFHPSQPFAKTLLENLGYRYLHSSYELCLTEVNERSLILRPEFTVETITDESFEEYYQVVVDGFSDSPDVSIATRTAAQDSFRKNIVPPIGVRDGQKLVAILRMKTLESCAEGQISALAVLPEWRGHGIGKYLLNYGIRYLKERKAHLITLSVAVANEKALHIYFDAGFEISEKYDSYLKCTWSVFLSTPRQGR